VLSAAPSTVGGITAIPGPQIVFQPSFAIFPADLEARFPTPKQIQISPRSTLVIEGDVVVEGLWLDGYLSIKAVPGTKIIVRAGQNSGGVVNAGQEMVALETLATYESSEIEAMRGFYFRVDYMEVVSTEDFVDSSNPSETVQAFIYNGKNLFPAPSVDSQGSGGNGYACFFGFC
jgi:hypothetical protein